MSTTGPYVGLLADDPEEPTLPEVIGTNLRDTLVGDGGSNNLVGLEGNDYLLGRGGDDTLKGDLDNDMLDGGAGADVLDGGAGFDYARYDTAGASVTASLAAPAANLGDAAGDTYASIEGLIGSRFGDTLIGNAGSNDIAGLGGDDTLDGGAAHDHLSGGEGNDTLIGGANDDILDGNGGIDAASYSNASTGVVASLSGTAANTGDAAGDIYVDIEGLIGSNFRDTLVGNGGANSLSGLAGDDYMQGRGGDDPLQGGNGNDMLDGGGGHDALDGGDGYDWARYDYAAGVVADLVTPTGNTGDASGDSYTSIEGVVGSAFNDTLRGDAGSNDLVGLGGSDTIEGGAGEDWMHGNGGNDVLTGGLGDDHLFGDDGNDRMVWNPGDGSDVLEGGDGTDTAEVNGGSGAETFTVGPDGTRVRFDRADPAAFTLDIGATENLAVSLNGGDDTFVASAGLASLIQLAVDGGAGNDTIIGSDGADLLFGGDDNDTVAGARGNDIALLGSGDDAFIWSPGDGSDIVEGDAGSDQLVFNGASVAEAFVLSAIGSRVSLARDVASIAMDLNGVESVSLGVRDGADTIIVNDLTGTDLGQVTINLAAAGGGGDNAADALSVNGTAGGDSFTVSGTGSSYGILGSALSIQVTNSEGLLDSVVIDALGGADAIDAQGLEAGVTHLTVNGGAGDDAIVGSQGADVLNAGDDDDAVEGGTGGDVVDLGNGNDAFEWNPGDGNDTVEGGSGTDALTFNGAADNEAFLIGANLTHASLTRDVGGVALDLHGIEQVRFHALGGTDAVTLLDLTGTDVSRVDVDLSAPGGAADGEVDAVTITGPLSNDTITVSGGSNDITVSGLAATVHVLSTDATDVLSVDAAGGNDTIDTGGVTSGAVRLIVNGGAGTDLFTGGAAGEQITGGTGNDTAIMGGGDDTFVWNPGDGSDIVEGQAGTDTLSFNGANVGESIAISANGSRVLLTRDVAGVAMDLNGVEHIETAVRGGADNITINNVTGTSLTSVRVDLGTDGAADTITVRGTSGDDVIAVVQDANGIHVNGLTAEVTIVGFETANDRLVIDVGDGADIIDAGGVAANGMQLTFNGGNGDDILIGGAANDILDGGPGQDVLIGGGGANIFLNGEIVVNSPNAVGLAEVPPGDYVLIA